MEAQALDARRAPCCSTPWPRRVSSGSTSRGALRPGGPRRGGPRPGQCPTSGPTTTRPPARPGQWSTRCSASGYRWRGPGAAAGDGPRRGADAWRPSASGSRRTTTRCSVCPRRPPTRRSRAPTGSWPSSTTPTPTRAPRTASRRSRPPTTCSATPTSARSTTRCAASGRWPAASAPGAGSAAATFRVEDMGDLGDLFGGLFGGGRTGRRRARGPQRGADVEAELHLSFEDAVHGVTTSVNVPEDARCHTCNGSGAAPGTATHTCDRCGGRGTLDDNQGLFSLSHGLPQVQRPGHHRGHPVPDLPRHRDRAPQPPGEGAHPGGGGGRPADPGEGPGRARPGHGPAGRPLRRGPGGSPPAVRPPGPQPDPDACRSPSPRRRSGRRSRCRRWTSR